MATINTYGEVEITPRMTPFVKAFRARFKRPPTMSADTYDAIYILREAIQRADTTDTEKLVPVIEKMNFVGSAGYIEFDRAHDPMWGIGKATGIGVQWQDGKQVPFWPPAVKGMQSFKLPGQPTS